MKETMKLALEALKNSVDSVSNEAREAESLYGKYPSRLASVQGLVALEVAHQTAIKALEEALANHCEDNLDMVKQEQGEPVEWGVDWGKDGNSVSIIKRLADGNIEVLAWEYAPHPQQRTWVGLTDEEVLQVRDDTTLDLRSHLDFYRACEAKRKDKNK
jgi:hypothetical protein